MSLDKYKVYDALARHTLAYPGINAATGIEWTTAERIDDILKVKAEADAKLEAIAAAVVVPAVAVDTTEHDAVNNYLLNLQATNPAQFEIERKLSFDDLKVKAGV